MACMKPAEAKRVIENKNKVNTWMGSANAVMDYYESRDRQRLPE